MHLIMLICVRFRFADLSNFFKRVYFTRIVSEHVLHVVCRLFKLFRCSKTLQNFKMFRRVQTCSEISKLFHFHTCSDSSECFRLVQTFLTFRFSDFSNCSDFSDFANVLNRFQTYHVLQTLKIQTFQIVSDVSIFFRLLFRHV